MDNEKVAGFMGEVKTEITNLYHRIDDLKADNQATREVINKTFKEMVEINQRCKQQEREEFMKIHKHVREMDKERIQPLEHWKSSIDTYGKVGAIILTVAQAALLTVWTVVLNTILRR